MNFPKGIQGILTLHGFIQLVLCALARTIFSFASQRTHAEVAISHIHETLSTKNYHPQLVKRQFSLPAHLFLQLCSVLTICPKMQINYKFLYQQKESILLLLRKN